MEINSIYDGRDNSKFAIDVLLTNTDIENTKFTNFDFGTLDLNCHCFNNVEFVDCHFNESCFINSQFINCTFKYSNFESADFYGAVFYGCNFNNTVGGFWMGVVFNDCIILQCKFDYKCFNFCNFKRCTIEGTRFDFSTFLRVNFFQCDFDFVSFRFVNFINCDFAENKGIDTNSIVPMSCPREGEFIGYKKVLLENSLEYYLVKLLIPKDAKRSSATGFKCRCDHALVLDIEEIDNPRNRPNAIISNNWVKTVYAVGEMVYADGFDEDRFVECTNGIHFFMNKQHAIDY